MKRHIVFTGGGTGGHVYPALAIIEKLEKLDYKISWIGSKAGIEYSIIQNQGIDFYSIPSGKLRRYFSFHNFIDIFKIFFGFIKSVIILKRIKPDLLFSKGGYVTVPPVVASKLLRIESITHESDFDPGLATKINSKFVNTIMVPYKETKEYFTRDLKNKVVVTGNPVRDEFYNTDIKLGKKIMGFDNNKPNILVLGGSLGAKEINDLMFSVKDEITEKFNVYHQMGSKNYIKIENESYKTVPYINSNISNIIAASTIIISRSGASLLWEFVTVGIPTILIPLTSGSRGDQLRNANYFKKKGASLVLTGEYLTKKTILDTLESLMDNKQLLNDMQSNAKKLGLENCSEKICAIIGEKL